MAEPAAAYRIFLDDSGQKEYGFATSRYFVYAGPMVPVGDEEDVARKFAALKDRVFGNSSVEVKSNWMRQPKERRKRYLEPYGLSEAEFDEFVEEWYQLMSSSALTYLAAVVDKPQMKQRYKSPWYASATAYQFLLQRYELQLRRCNGIGHVTIDDMSGSTPAHNRWRDLLRSQHRRLRKDGCPLTNLTFDHVSNSFRFGNSAHFDLLQVADVVAYNVYRQFRDHGDEWDRTDGHHVPLYPWLERVLPRFAFGPHGVLEGWGIVKWPSERESRWVVNFKEAEVEEG